jgi:hypothetical protein
VSLNATFVPHTSKAVRNLPDVALHPTVKIDGANGFIKKVDGCDVIRHYFKERLCQPD